MSSVAEVLQFPEGSKRVKADLDDGWYKIANTLSLKLCSVDMNSREWKIFNAVKHLTLGYKKSTDWISASQFEELTGIAAKKISEIKNRLIERQILISDGRKIGINFVVSEWLDKNSTSKSIPLNRGKNTPKQEPKTPKQGKKHPQIGGHHKKDKHTQERITTVELPNTTDPCEQVIEYLNAKTGKRFKNVKSHQKFITARLGEGYSVTDLMTVIDKKTSEWLKNPKMNQYLRPSTLFNSEKFDGYLNSEVLDASEQPARYISDLDHESNEWVGLAQEML